MEITVDDAEGTYPLDFGKVNVEVLHKGKIRRASGTLDKPVTVKM